MTKFHYKEGVYSTEPGESHLNYISQNETYTPEENNCLVDLTTEIPATLNKLEQALQKLDVDKLRK